GDFEGDAYFFTLSRHRLGQHFEFVDSEVVLHAVAADDRHLDDVTNRDVEVGVTNAADVATDAGAREALAADAALEGELDGGGTLFILRQRGTDHDGEEHR